MALERFIYPIDFTATNATNLAMLEEYTIGVGKYRTIVPNKGAIYADTIVLKEAITGTELIRGTDYECLYTYSDLIRMASGKEVVGAIVVFNESSSSSLIMSYQFVGGPYSSSAVAIQQAIDALDLDDRDVLFENLINTPDYFIAAPHVHDIGDVFGFEYIISLLSSLRQAILIGDNAINNTIKASIEALEILLTNKINAHLEDLANPHETTAHQTGAYNYAEIDAELQRIATEFATVAPQFSAVIEQIRLINLEIGSINGVLTSQSNILNGFQNNVNSLELSLALSNANIVVNTQDIADLYDITTDISNELVNINTAIDKINVILIAYGTRLDSIENAAALLNSAVATNVINITALKNRAVALEDRATNTEGDVSNLQSNLGDYVNWGNVTSSSDTTAATINSKVPRIINNAIKLPNISSYYSASGNAILSWITSYNTSVGSWTHYCDQRLNVLDVYIRSDERDKSNITFITPESADKMLANIGGGIRYKLKGQRKYTAGVSAQTIQKYFKDGVITSADPMTKVKRLSVIPGALIGLLFSGYTFIRNKVVKHDSRIKLLEKRQRTLISMVDTLLSEIDKLKYKS